MSVSRSPSLFHPTLVGPRTSQATFSPGRTHPAHPISCPCFAPRRGLAVAFHCAILPREPPVQPTDLTIEILKGIRDEVRSTNSHLDETNGRLDALRDSTEGRFDRLDRRQAETEVRLSTELVAVVGAVREVRDLLREDLAVQSRIDDHERRIAAIETRVG
jgi:hypothetical protein